MKTRKVKHLLLCLLVACAFAACDELDQTWDPYHDWKDRNAKWFEQVADTARQSIAEAKALFGDAWEDHCDWRMYKVLSKSEQMNSGKLADSICVKIAKRGTGSVLPNCGDSVRLSFRGWLMETQYDNGDGKLFAERRVFTQTYFGDFDPRTASPSLSAVDAMISGFATALQYMSEGADWYVYIPQELAYGAKADGDIPAYSTLLFRINMAAVYPAGSGVPSWKVSPKRQ